jgi:hypothetical protein
MMSQRVDAALIWVAAASGSIGAAAHSAALMAVAGGVATLSWLAAARLLRQYDPTAGRTFPGDVALTATMLCAVALPVAALAHTGLLSELSGLRFAAVLLAAGLSARVATVGLKLRAASPTEAVVIAGVGSLGRLTRSHLDRSGSRQHVVGYLRFDGESPHARLGAPLVGDVSRLERTLEQRVVDEVYFASTQPEHAADVQEGIRVCERLGVPFALPLCAYRLTRARPANDAAPADGYAHFLSVSHKPLQRWVKRSIDIVASLAALIALAPLLIAAAIAIKATSRGPALFRQARVGLHGRAFAMLKFRSMVDGADGLKSALLARNEQSGPVFKMKADPRVTRVGRVLRKYSIDELPQLVNVLRGDMSLVGPRPPIPAEVARYEAWQRRRLSVRPGLTCVWQVSGRNQISFEEWMLLDMRYIDHWSLLGDLFLILKTVPVVLSGRGAS